MTDPQLAMVAALFGGAGLKLLDLLGSKLLNRGSERFTEATTLRKELRDEVAGLKTELVNVRTEIRALQEEVDEWREKYYQLLEEYMALNAKYAVVKDELDELRASGEDK